MKDAYDQNDPQHLDDAIAHLQAEMARLDVEMEQIRYLDGHAQEIKAIFVRVDQCIRDLEQEPRRDNVAISQVFSQQIVPILIKAKDDLVRVPLMAPSLQALHRLAVDAVKYDLEAFSVLATAYERRDSQLLARGRELRGRSAERRRAWLRGASTLGVSLGLYEAKE